MKKKPTLRVLDKQESFSGPLLSLKFEHAIGQDDRLDAFFGEFLD